MGAMAASRYLLLSIPAWYTAMLRTGLDNLAWHDVSSAQLSKYKKKRQRIPCANEHSTAFL
jgi:hypothetical protein